MRPTPGPWVSAGVGSGVILLLRPASGFAHTPIAPGEAWLAWNWDPWILAVLAVALVMYLRGVGNLWGRAGRDRGISRWRAGSYLLGIWTLYIALISPVHALGHTLFSMHMVQHMILMVVSAPLLVLGRPLHAYLWALPVAWRRRVGDALRRRPELQRSWAGVTHPASVLVLHVGALWAWHVPALYEAALESYLIHTLEHASFFFTATLFWWILVSRTSRRSWPGYGAAVLYVFATALQSGALGALITFAPRRWYPGHDAGAHLWEMDALADQQLAGVLMWVPAGLVYTAAAVALFVAWLRRTEAEMARRERTAAFAQMIMDQPDPSARS